MTPEPLQIPPVSIEGDPRAVGTLAILMAGSALVGALVSTACWSVVMLALYII
jgi:hypothetical protein